MAARYQVALARALGKLPDGPPAYPPVSAGAIMAGAPAAGSYFPQFIGAGGARLDDVLGAGEWLITRPALDEPALAPFAAALGAWLERTGAEAVLVRPDRYVFGAGAPDALRAAWQGQMRG